MWMEHSAGKQHLWELHRCLWVLILGLSMGSDRSTGGLMVPSPSSWCRGCAPTRGVEGRVVELKLLGTSKFDEALKTNPLSRLADAGHTLTPACGVVAREQQQLLPCSMHTPRFYPGPGSGQSPCLDIALFGRAGGRQGVSALQGRCSTHLDSP